jgi:hypothetical protein
MKMWWLHGPPSTENRTKIPYKSIVEGQQVGGGRIEPTATGLQLH